MIKKIIFLILFFALNLKAYEIYKLELTEQNEILFHLEYEKAYKVAIAGNFNNWDKNVLMAEREELGIWTAKIKLEPGEYEYKFVINDNEWIPADNIKFKIILEGDKLKLEGGEGIKIFYEKKANIKISDKIFIKGNYKFIFIPYYNFKENNSKTFKNRHILNLEPEIYINENVFLNSVLFFDIPSENALSLWRAKFVLNQPFISFTFFNNERTIFLDEPLKIIEHYIYNANYPLFVHPLEFYNNQTDESKFGYNYRGIETKLNIEKFYFNGFYVKPMFKNFDISGGILKRIFKSGEVGIIKIIERGKYDNYPVNENFWSVYQIKPSTLFKESEEYLINKTGIQFYLKANDFLGIFGEYISKSKEGGFYLETAKSDGSDLPENCESFKISYNKAIHYYNSSFEGNEFIAGIHLILKNILKNEISIKSDSLKFKPTFLENVKPQIYTFKWLAKFNYKNFNHDLEFKLISGNKNAKYFNYSILFDELNFYNLEIPTAYKKFTIREKLNFTLKSFRIIFENYYNNYFQRDIYFYKEDEWQSFTYENKVLFSYNFKNQIEPKIGYRIKYYNFSQYLTEDLFEKFKKIFVNYYIGVDYMISKNFKINAGIGIDTFTIDEENYEGFYYYLNENLKNRFPIFEDAEKKFSEQFILSIKAEAEF